MKKINLINIVIPGNLTTRKLVLPDMSFTQSLIYHNVRTCHVCGDSPGSHFILSNANLIILRAGTTRGSTPMRSSGPKNYQGIHSDEI